MHTTTEIWATTARAGLVGLVGTTPDARPRSAAGQPLAAVAPHRIGAPAVAAPLSAQG